MGHICNLYMDFKWCQVYMTLAELSFLTGLQTLTLATLSVLHNTSFIPLVWKKILGPIQTFFKPKRIGYIKTKVPNHERSRFRLYQIQWTHHIFFWFLVAPGNRNMSDRGVWRNLQLKKARLVLIYCQPGNGLSKWHAHRSWLIISERWSCIIVISLLCPSPCEAACRRHGWDKPMYGNSLKVVAWHVSNSVSR